MIWSAPVILTEDIQVGGSRQSYFKSPDNNIKINSTYDHIYFNSVLQFKYNRFNIYKNLSINAIVCKSGDMTAANQFKIDIDFTCKFKDRMTHIN